MIDNSTENESPDARSSGCLINIENGLFLLFGRLYKRKIRWRK